MDEHRFDPKRRGLVSKGLRRRAHLVLGRDAVRNLRDELQDGSTWDPRSVANALNAEVETIASAVAAAIG